MRPGEVANPWRGLGQTVDTEPDGLDTLSAVLVALREGAPVPLRAAEHLAQALRPCLNGDNDIAGRLGLRAPRRGGSHEAPVARNEYFRRDELLRSIVCGMGGGPATHAAQALQVLWVYYLENPPLPHAVSVAGRSLSSLSELTTNHRRPLSCRQVLRIINGEPAYNKRRKK